MNKPIIPQPDSTANVPFDPACINIPICVAVQGRDENGTGVSELSVFLSALFIYQERVPTWEDDHMKDHTINLVYDLRDTVLRAVIHRLSDSTELLRNLTPN